jgi:MoaA/NifB/PqqE/SkfB family radical SAM enzyme
MIWCPIPWSHIAVKSNGQLRLCSHSQSGGNKRTVLEKDGTLLRIEDLDKVSNCDTLKEVRSKFLKNEWPDQCRRCRVESESGKRSRNEWESTMYEFTEEDARAITQNNGTVSEFKVLSLDLRLGNKCNLQCVMCYPGESNQWGKIQETITGHKVFMIDESTYNDVDHKDFSWCDQEEYYKLISNHSNFVQKIKFGGGEPFLIKKHITLLKMLINEGLAKNIELEYSINVTILPNYIFDLFPNFKLVKICASIDGIDIVNETIRYPTKWEVVEKNLDLLDNTQDNISVFTSTTVSILNLEHIVTWMLWLNKKEFKKINKNTFAGVVSHPVMNPKYLNLGLMTDDQHNRMFTYLKQQTTDKEILTKLNQWEVYSKKMPITHDEILQGRDELRKFFIKMSAIQNKDWKLIFPKCYEMISEWNH